jgi:hypothetical protein
MERLTTLVLLLVALLIGGCQVQIEGDTTQAVKALETYLSALVNKDEATLTTLSCADWEASALLELDTFQSVVTTLEDLSCKQTAAEGDSATVVCQGKIVASYGQEDQGFDLGERTYTVVEQGGDWLVCGYE